MWKFLGGVIAYLEHGIKRHEPSLLVLSLSCVFPSSERERDKCPRPPDPHTGNHPPSWPRLRCAGVCPGRLRTVLGCGLRTHVDPAVLPPAGLVSFSPSHFASGYMHLLETETGQVGERNSMGSAHTPVSLPSITSFMVFLYTHTLHTLGMFFRPPGPGLRPRGWLCEIQLTYPPGHSWPR